MAARHFNLEVAMLLNVLLGVVVFLVVCVLALWSMVAAAQEWAARANDRITANENARDLAEKFHGSVVRWGELKEHLEARDRAFQKLALENKAALERDPVITQSVHRADHDLLAAKIASTRDALAVVSSVDDDRYASLVSRVSSAENDIMWIERWLDSQGWAFAKAEQPRWTKAKK